MLPMRTIPSDLESVLLGALEQRELTKQIAAEAVRRGITRVIFTGVGGSWASGVPANTFLGSQLAPFTSENINATDLSALYLPSIGATTLVVATSHSGGTPETVAAAQAAAERGAFVIGLARDSAGPLSAAAHFSLIYGSERTITSAKYLLLSELSYSLLEATDGSYDFVGIRSALDCMPAATVAAVEKLDPILATYANQFAKSDNIYVLGSGPMVGLSYMLSVCYLVEMQWIKSTYFTAADFFHGPFEMAQNEQPYILITGEDETRSQIGRVKKFLSTYDSNFVVLDTADIALDGVTTELRSVVGHIPMASIVSRFADHFEQVTGHNLDERMYMNRVEY